MTIDGSKAIAKIKTLLESNLLPDDAVKAFEQSIKIIQSCDLDRCGDDITVTTASGAELSPHEYEEFQVIHNAKVYVMRCRNCGDIDIWWERNENKPKTLSYDDWNKTFRDKERYDGGDDYLPFPPTM